MQCHLDYQQKNMLWSFGGDYSFKHYIHPSRQYDLRRRDALVKVYTSVSLMDFIIQPLIKIEHMINTSTIDDFDYRKTSITGSFRYVF